MARRQCDNCDGTGPFKHEFTRETDRLTITKTVFFCDAKCLRALEKKWKGSDTEVADKMLAAWGTLPLGQTGVHRDRKAAV